MKIALNRFIHKVKLFGYKHDKICAYVVLLIATTFVCFFVVGVHNVACK